MNNIDYITKDKKGWPDGPWMNEPDKKQFTDANTGYPCLIVRNGLGALCGYVGVNKDHPYFEIPYSQIDGISVHGGLTFSSKCHEDGEEGEVVCHKVEDGEDDNVWWLGFDCSHGFDLSPKIGIIFGPDKSCVYRDIDYVENQISKLAIQLRDVADGKPEISRKEAIVL